MTDSLCMSSLDDRDRAALKEIARRMRAARIEARVRKTQTEVALEVGASQPRVSKWERAAAIPSAIELIRFARACQSRPEIFVEGIVAPTIEQLHLELDPQAGEVVADLVRILHERRLGETPASA